jgi:hypothetical protein
MENNQKHLKNEPIQQIYKKILKPAEKVALTCFIEKDLLLTRIEKTKKKELS